MSDVRGAADLWWDSWLAIPTVADLMSLYTIAAREGSVSHPTVLGPWFVVQRLNEGDPFVAGGGPSDDVHMEYYQHGEDGEDLWTRDKKLACLFVSLHTADRVAAATVGEVRVLTSLDHAKEFGRN